MPARSAAPGRPLGVTVLSLSCFAAAAWSLAAAALPGVFFGGRFPAYPPLLMLQRHIVAGEGRFVGVLLTPFQRTLAAAAIGAGLALLGVLLWKRVRLGPYAFLAVLWIAPAYYAAAFWCSTFAAVARQGLAAASPGVRLLVWGNLVAAAAVLLLVTAYVWRRRARFQ